MKISELVRTLNAQKKSLGDVEVLLDLEDVLEKGDHGEYTHEASITLTPVKIGMYNADKGTISRRTHKVLSIGID